MTGMPSMLESCFTFRRIGAVIPLLILSFFHATGAAAAACLVPVAPTDLSACEQELQQNPRDIRLRRALTEALIGLGKRREAIKLLEAGLKLHPEDEQMQEMLKLQRSFLEEKAWAEKQRLSREESVTEKSDPRIRLNVIRCTKLKGEAALEACDEGLAALPGDVDLVLGKAEALLDMNRIVEAILLLREARASHASNTQFAEMVGRAEAKRKLLSGQCFTRRGAEALKACDIALLKGAADELRIQRRRADLLFEQNRAAEALAAHKAARRLKSAKTGADDGEVEESAVRERSAEAAAAPPKVAVAEPTPAKPAETVSEAESRIDGGQAKRGANAAAPSPVTAQVTRYSNAPLRPGITY
ncbi:MAG: tetratricopeptide repeat protein [Gammaproteobacteria bacterium]|nr:tetratricopeptide repeat protein [Gammaproteobacteria bacterium]